MRFIFILFLSFCPEMRENVSRVTRECRGAI